MEDLVIERASSADWQEVYALYRSLTDMPYSTWDDDYPTAEIVRGDIEEHTVLVLRDGAGRIAAAIALWEAFEFADAACWYPDVKQWAMLSRLGVRPDHQGHGIAKKMILAAMDAAREAGCDAVQFLVARGNPIAQRAYAPLGFDICGSCTMWEEEWLCYQKRL